MLLLGIMQALWLLNKKVIFHQAYLFMFYNVRTTYWTFVGKNRTLEYEVNALRNSESYHTLHKIWYLVFD